MRDNLFHASTAESIGSRHAETYRRKMRSANAGGANATTAGLNSPISEERRREKEREKNSLVPRPLEPRALADPLPPPPSFRLPSSASEATIFHPINRQTEAVAKNRAPSLASKRARRGRCNLSRNHFYLSRSGVISSPKARTRLRPPCEPPAPTCWCDRAFCASRKATSPK